jgi:hypothetical protein
MTEPSPFEDRDASARDEAPAIALESVRVAGLLEGKRFGVLGVGWRALDRSRQAPVVTIYNYTDDLAIEVLVDVEDREVLAVSDAPAAPALTAAEQARALDIVRSDGRLAEFGVDVDTGTAILVQDVDFGDPRHGHRLVDLRFGTGRYHVPTAFAMVDLSAEELVGVGVTQEL